MVEHVLSTVKDLFAEVLIVANEPEAYENLEVDVVKRHPSIPRSTWRNSLRSSCRRERSLLRHRLRHAFSFKKARPRNHIQTTWQRRRRSLASPGRRTTSRCLFQKLHQATRRISLLRSTERSRFSLRSQSPNLFLQSRKSRRKCVATIFQRQHTTRLFPRHHRRSARCAPIRCTQSHQPICIKMSKHNDY